MSIREKILSMRMDEFGFSKISFLGSDKDVFPNNIHIVKWEETEPFRAYSINEKKYVEKTSYCFAIGELEWNKKEPCWEFRSIGTRYLEEGNDKLNKWILDFCNKYIVKDGKIMERDKDE